MQATRELSAAGSTCAQGILHAAIDRLADEGLLAFDREEALDGRLLRNCRRKARRCCAPRSSSCALTPVSLYGRRVIKAAPRGVRFGPGMLIWSGVPAPAPGWRRQSRPRAAWPAGLAGRRRGTGRSAPSLPCRPTPCGMVQDRSAVDEQLPGRTLRRAEQVGPALHNSPAQPARCGQDRRLRRDAGCSSQSHLRTRRRSFQLGPSGGGPVAPPGVPSGPTASRRGADITKGDDPSEGDEWSWAGMCMTSSQVTGA
jgi:hypothetical protein